MAATPSRRRDRRPEALILDPGVLGDGPVCEFQSDLAVAAHGGTVVQPWRDRFRAAEAEGLAVVADGAELATASQAQVVVHLQKSRAATFTDLQQAWRALLPGGRLLFAGTNALGVVSAVKRLSRQLDQPGIVVSNRAHARVVRFEKRDGPEPVVEASPDFDVEVESIAGERQAFRIETLPGVFSAKKLDAGSELLLAALPRFVAHKPPKRVVDLGCGAGVFGIAAALLWPEARVLLVDADARAVECARRNIARLELEARCELAWWDAREPVLDARFDLALVNPPFHHRGPEVDLGPAFALFRSLQQWIKPGARALLVANRTLPYERPLAEIGTFEILRSERGYKLISLKRSARSSGARGRSDPGSRFVGRSRAPIRSR